MQNLIFAHKIALALVIAIVVPACVHAQNQAPKSHPRYRLVDLGTLGGPVSYESADGPGGRILNNSGVVSSFADTTAPDPYAPDFCFDLDCLVAHAFRWQNGVMHDLGTLASGYSSLAASINDRGWSAGFAQTGVIDPITGGPQEFATLWKDGRLINLGALPGGNESLGVTINNAGQVIGISNNGIPDPFAPIPFGQNRTFFWARGQMIDIGTLGGPDALPGGGCDNQRPGTLVGFSYTSYTPNQNTGVPTQDPFLWDNGEMTNLGNLGGTLSIAQCANNREEVIGTSDLPGDLVNHAFVWRDGQMTDLGTLGGDNSEAIWINDAGDVVGDADLAGNLGHDAFLWSKGVMTDLGTLGDLSFGAAINSKTQVVGAFYVSGRTEPPFRHAFLWEKAGPMVDLNNLIPANSGLELVAADNINERGEIVGVGVPARCFPDFCGHLFLLIPCASEETLGCQDNGERPNAALQSDPGPIAASSASTPVRPAPDQRVAAWRAQIASRYHITSRRTPRE